MVTITKPFLKYSFTIGMTTMDGRGFYYPTDAVLGRSGRIYVPNRSIPGVDRGVRICVCDEDGGYYGVFGFLGEDEGQFKWHCGGAADSEGLLYFSDEYTHRISVFEDPSQEFVRKWGVHGSGEGELDTPSGLAFDAEDNLYVSDTYNNRIQKFTKNGRFLLSFGSEGDRDGQINLPWGLDY